MSVPFSYSTSPARERQLNFSWEALAMLHRQVWSAVFLGSLLVIGYPVLAQGIFATLTGVVSDQAGSVVPNAKISLKDAISGSARETVTNGDGYYTFASVPVGTYVLSVEAQGFRQYEASDISLGGGERRNVNVQLQVGTTQETVQVSAENTSLAVTDSGEKSFCAADRRTAELHPGGQQRRRIHQDCSRIRHRQRHAEQIQLQRTDHRHQCQRRLREPEPSERRLLLQRSAEQTHWTSRPTARTSLTRAATATRR